MILTVKWINIAGISLNTLRLLGHWLCRLNVLIRLKGTSGTDAEFGIALESMLYGL